METARDFNYSRTHSSTKIKSLSLSSQLWGIDWEKELAALPEFEVNGTRYRVEYSDHQTVTNFLISNFKEELSQVFVYQESEQVKSYRTKFYTQMGDSFIARESTGEIISFLVGNALDWSSYYSRFTMTLPEKRRLGAYGNISDSVFEILKKHAVERVIGEFHPGHKAQLRFHSQEHTYITGNIQTDRWGQLLQATTFLDSKCEKKFFEQFQSPILAQFSEKRS